MSELISVVVPVYKVEKQLSRCVDSLIRQTYDNIEIILVDDGSPDGCPAICDGYAKKDSRIKVIHRQNGGLSAARNSGIEAASGEYIAFVDSDDYVADDYIDFMYRMAVLNNADVVSCGVREVYPSGKSALQYADNSLIVMDKKEALTRMCYNDGFFVTAWDKLYKRSLFDEVRYIEGKLFEDTGTTYLVIDKAERIVSCPEPKYFYMINPDSITGSQFNMRKLEYVEMADRMAEYIVKKYPELEMAARRKQMHACFSTLTQLVNSGVRNKEVENMLVLRIKELEGTALSDKRTPVRDRLAIYSLRMGFRFFSFVWRVYYKIKKG